MERKGRPEPVTMPLTYQEADSVTVPLSSNAAAAGTNTAILENNTQPVLQQSPLQEAINRAAYAPYGGMDDEKTMSLVQTEKISGPVVGWLVCIGGKDFGRSFTLKSGRNFIGRASNMDVPLHGNDTISMEKHAVIVYEPKKREFYAKEGESRELYYVNDEVVLAPVQLSANDILMVGDASLMFVPFCGEAFSWDDLKKDDGQGQENS